MNIASSTVPVRLSLSLSLSQPRRAWWNSPVTLLSVALHGLLLLALWQLSRQPQVDEPPARTIELVLEKLPAAEPEPPHPAPPPQPQPVARPLQLAPARPAVVTPPAPLPVRTVDSNAAQAEVQVPPRPETPPPTPTPAPAPAPEPAAAKPVAALARVIATDGIPSDYVNQVYTRINRHVVYPRVARLRGEEGRVGYRLTLNPQGELINIVIQPSGSAELDQAAAKAIKAAAPFPKLPELGGSTYLLAGSIQFSLNAP